MTPAGFDLYQKNEANLLRWWAQSAMLVHLYQPVTKPIQPAQTDPQTQPHITKQTETIHVIRIDNHSKSSQICSTQINPNPSKQVYKSEIEHVNIQFNNRDLILNLEVQPL